MVNNSTDTVTFLFTDIEGSTELLQRVGRQYADLLERHRTIIRAAVAEHAGTERGTEGDSFFVTFDNPSAAIAAAATAQRLLLAERWPDSVDLRVRMGIHLGEVTTTAEGPVGLAIHHAARIAAAANGGQIVLSDGVRTAAATLPSGADVVAIGSFRLRDLGTVRLYQLNVPGLPVEFPPLRAPTEAPGNLPVELTTFVGRTSEIDRLLVEVANHRLTTLIGVGGTGKTRLAVEAGRALESSFPDGCWLVQLAPIAVEEAVPFAFAAGLGLTAPMDRDVVGDLVAKLRDKRLLIVVDNCEHLLGATADVIERIVVKCPTVSVVATSREPLMVSGERLVPVPSLPSDEAEGLFLDRARAEAPDLVIDADQRQAVTELCRRLDGLPLAIELAASRVRSFSPVELVTLLDERFRLLVGGRRSRIERHQTMRGTLDWSYDLCSNIERVVFDRLSVFPSEFDLSAARAVAAVEGVRELDVADIVPQLVDRSLLQRSTADDGTTRYRMLETMRAYGREHLQQSGASDVIRERHVRYIADTICELALRSLGPDEKLVARRLAEYLPDALVALGWCIDHHEWELAMRIVQIRVTLDRRETGEMCALLNDALSVAGEAADLHDELQRVDRRTRLRETVAEAVERGLRCIRSRRPVPRDRPSWPPYSDFQYGGYTAAEANELVASLADYLDALPLVRFHAEFAAIRSLIHSGHLEHVEELLQRFELLVRELRSDNALDALAYLRGSFARERREWTEAAEWFSRVAAPAAGEPVEWFDLTVAWHTTTARALSTEPFDITSTDLVQPWQWFRQEPHLTVLRQHGAVSTALALHRIGRDDLAARFVAWVHRDADATPLEGFTDLLDAAGISLQPVARTDDLDTLIDALFAIAGELDTGPE